MFGRKRRSDCELPILQIRRGLWDELVGELARRGSGERESGAFLLGTSRDGRRRVLDVVYYDDLDPDSLTGGISFRGAAYARLWDECGQRHLDVVGDVHTHPGRGVQQSDTDRRHPMLARPQHVALIVPCFARTPVDPSIVGYHVYLGDAQWKSVPERLVPRYLRIPRWFLW